ncbi:hypothetical protein E7T09_21465 [Deinococcus sp. KSM4-11]|uniref:hypothetical protein n=1 Tax=Deinococcus sp. KSM4-11 TaxID=2568654 RepID=UPI0010A2AC1F|nr:hypothetical protein [Deinococcus sp. KSM4-11]THF83597.1 hypothetical protein E7T09_21465 [Deinococcus sp. KSM4-11]
MSDFPGPHDVDADLALDVFAAQLRLEHRDATEQAEAIAARLQALLPHLTTRTNQGSWLLRSTALKSLRVVLGADHYELLVDGPHVHYRTAHHVGGIDLSHQDWPQDQWIAQLKASLANLSGQLGSHTGSTL